MASKTHAKQFGIGQILLILYVGVAVTMIVLTLALALADQTVSTTSPPAAEITPTRDAFVLTLQAEEYVTQVPVATRQP